MFGKHKVISANAGRVGGSFPKSNGEHNGAANVTPQSDSIQDQC